MAFNPFTSFRKYQKFWMASAVLVCMVTFVLCSGGMKGMGLDDVLMSLVRRGPEYVKISGKSFTHEQFNELKRQRNIANAFMRELLGEAVTRLTADIKRTEGEGKRDKSEEFWHSIRKTCLADLYNKLHRDAHYFHGSDKVDDLVDFILWRDVADKNNVVVTDNVLRALVAYSCHGQYPRIWDFNPDTSRELERKVSYMHGGASASDISAALKQEFKVQIAQLALATRWSQGPRHEREEIANLPVGNEVAHIYLNFPMQTRIAPTPEEINASYRKSRTELTIELLPISLQMLAGKIEMPSDPQKRLEVLKEFYDKHARKPYNPSMDSPGFLFPEKVDVQFFAADAGMEFYKQPAQAVSILQKVPPVAFNALSPLEGTIGWLASTPAWGASIDRNLEKDRAIFEQKWDQRYMVLSIYKNQYLSETDEKKKNDAKTIFEERLNDVLPAYKNSASSWTTPLYYSPGQFNLALEKPNAEAAASLVIGLGAGPMEGLAAFQQAAYDVQAKKIAPMVSLARTKRMEVGSELVLSHLSEITGGNPFLPAGLTYYAATKQQFLPVAGFIEEDLRSKIEGRLAQKWVNSVMADAKERLEKGSVKGNNAPFADQVSKIVAKYSRDVVDKDGKTKSISGLTFGNAQDLNEFEVEYTESLKPLRESFDNYRNAVNFAEGRPGKPEMLREGDFHKLFFGSEPLGVGPLRLFDPMIWPPTVSVPKARQDPLAPPETQKQFLFDKAEKPVILWKTRKTGKEPMPWQPDDPKKMELVETQYRLNEARSKIMDEVKKVAEELKKAQKIDGKDLVTVMRELAKQHGTETLTLNKVARLVENQGRRTDEPAYVEYELPRNKIPFSRPDMIQQLLALQQLPAALKIDADEFKNLNELNSSLFLTPEKDAKTRVGQQVQVLTNKPRSVYYLATVASTKEPPTFSFFEEPALTLGRDGSTHSFMDQVQTEQGRELLQLLSQYLRGKAEVDYSEDAKKLQKEEAAMAAANPR